MTNMRNACMQTAYVQKAASRPDLKGTCENALAVLPM